MYYIVVCGGGVDMSGALFEILHVGNGKLNRGGKYTNHHHFSFCFSIIANCIALLVSIFTIVRCCCRVINPI